MNRDTARAILVAAALMTAQALLLAALAANGAHAGTVYRCTSPSSGAITYQARPCPDQHAGTAVQASDARTAEQQSQARQNHARQMAWLQERDKASADDAPAPRHKRQRARTRRSARAAPVAVPLTSHRIGERPFERLGQQVTPPDKAQKHKRRRGDITARTPVQPRQADAGARLDIKRRP